MKRLLIADHLSSALHSLRSNRMRSFLTTLGITIGIASVTTILTLAAGLINSLTHQVEDIGGNIAVIRPGVTTSQSQLPSLNRPISSLQYSTSTIDENDVTKIRALALNLQVAPIMTIEGRMTSHGGNISDGTVVATTPEFNATTPLPLSDGSLLDSKTPPQAAVIGYQMALDLFGTDNPIGQTFHLRKQSFTIIGVLKKTKNPVNYNNIDFDRAIIISFETGKAFHGGRSQVQQINVRAADKDTLEQVVPKIEQQLEVAHGERDFSVIAGKAVTEPTNTIFNTIANIMSAIAAISLVVGGIGIMNIMLVSVAERTREVGIRKAVGASNFNIIMQFLVESLLISLLGGIIGIILGALLAFILGYFLYFLPVITWQTIAIGAGLALLVGVIFGLYPALRAARKDPIDSLRQYR